MNASTPNNALTVLIWRSVGPYHLARAAAAAEACADAGHRLEIIELCDAEQTRDWVVDRAAAEVTIHTLWPGGRLADRGAAAIDLVKRMREHLDRLRPRCIAVAGYDRPEMREAVRWARRHGARVVLMSETTANDRARRWWRRALLRLWMGRYDAALVSGAAATEYLVGLGFPAERISTTYAAVDNAFFERRADEARRSGDRPCDVPAEAYFLACGRLIDERKNFVRLIEAHARYVADAGAGAWPLVICGDGEDRAMIERAASTTEGVSLVGFRQSPDLARYYAHAGGFIHAATREAWGLVVNEAMAAGLPVLVSNRCGCARDLVRNGVNGLTFDPDDVNAMAAAMKRLVAMSADERDAMGQASRRIIADFSPQRFAEGLVEAFALEGAPAGPVVAAS
ncbi:MAG: glycosyltransferase [Phycisphaera sp.]|nr:glycosyltransferase [Phycisphaera sp.]